MPKALVAMSGGVDSSAAALLAGDMGYECVGAMMRLYDNADAGIPEGRSCCNLSDADDARRVAMKLGMRFYVFNFTDDFRRRVMGRFACEYMRGATPNPCIDCNRYMKFEKLMDRADMMGCEKLVTGHYARVERKGGKYVLKKARDVSKDQSYVLYMLTQDKLSRLLLPLGELKKTEVRAIAESRGLITARKRESQDICFAPDGDYAAVIERCTGRKCAPGVFTDEKGAVLGRHEGVIRYTVGQRRGLGVAAGGRLYVRQIIPPENRVVLGAEDGLYSKSLTAADFNWISGEAPRHELRCRAKIRYRQPEQPCRARRNPDGTVDVEFDEPQRAIARGQAVVLYDGDTVLGGGTIM